VRAGRGGFGFGQVVAGRQKFISVRTSAQRNPHTYSFFASDVFVPTHTGQQVSQYQPSFFVGMCRTVGRRPHFLHAPCTEDDWMQGFTALASRLMPDPQSRGTLDLLDRKHYVPLPAAISSD
jgi:hypothetical protein